jgi:hypothetical protein
VAEPSVGLMALTVTKPADNDRLLTLQSGRSGEGRHRIGLRPSHAMDREPQNLPAKPREREALRVLFSKQPISVAAQTQPGYPRQIGACPER